jgi:predicted Fe-Mo cluster-binding NifX family protein
MRIAVATMDGRNVNEHFGRAEEFRVFDLIANGPEFVERRPVTPLSVGDKNHDFDEARFQAIQEKIADCGRVYVTRIGEKPAAELRRHGVMPVLSHAAIEDISI